MSKRVELPFKTAAMITPHTCEAEGCGRPAAHYHSVMQDRGIVHAWMCEQCKQAVDVPWMKTPAFPVGGETDGPEAAPSDSAVPIVPEVDRDDVTGSSDG